MAAALRIAAESRPEMSGTRIAATVLSAEQLTLAEAAKQLHRGAQPPTAYPADLPVWLVGLSGEWVGQASAPGLPPDQTVYHTRTIILDARTGLEVESQASP